MLRYTMRRLALAVLVAFLVTLLTFILFHNLPGGPAAAIAGHHTTKPQIQAFIHENGLDKPLLTQYRDYLSHLLHGNLGYSFKRNQTVNAILAEDLPKSIVLVGASTLLALFIGLSTGLFQALRRNTFTDHFLTGASFIFYAMPDFWLGLILIDWFAIRLHVFPTEGPQGSWTEAFTQPSGMVLPIATLSLTSIAVFSRYMRSSALDVFGQDYIRIVRSKGASTGRILWSHTLRNAGIPIITLLGLSLPDLLSGAIITEEVFNYPGIGLETFNAAVNRDYALELGITIIIAIAVIVGNLISDLAYSYLDPRVRVT
ncbi:MAG TPA: ABC transporter permease [Mycobacteriales bacterium]|nr:ABC transporter permease [Mycobacteriales bacterium]